MAPKCCILETQLAREFLGQLIGKQWHGLKSAPSNRGVKPAGSANSRFRKLLNFQVVLLRFRSTLKPKTRKGFQAQVWVGFDRQRGGSNRCSRDIILILLGIRHSFFDTLQAERLRVKYRNTLA